MKLAIAGKGGVGKTTLASLLARIYSLEGRQVIAIDADPDANLAGALGISAEEARNVKPIAELEQLIEERTGAKPGAASPFFKLNPRVDDIPERFSLARDNIRLLVMGRVCRGGAGCLCPESAVLRSLISHLLLGRSEVVIMDMEAGLEHLGRGTARGMDAFIVVVEPGQRSLETAAAVCKLARDLGINDCYAVGFKTHSEADRVFIRQGVSEFHLLGFVDFDPQVAEADRRGASVFDSAPRAVAAVREIKAELERLHTGKAEAWNQTGKGVHVAKLTVKDVEVKGKRVLVRVDFNVPLEPQSNEIADDARIRAVLPTINYLLERQSRVILCSHLGRPKASEREFSLAPVAVRLSQLLGKPVQMAADCVGLEVERAVAALQEGQILMLENLRFHRAEEANDPGFAQALARLADIFVEDGFGVVHRAHASTVGVARYLPAVAGLLVQKELDEMGKALHEPAHPFSAIVGGAKVSDKIAVLENLLDKVNTLMLAGGLGATFLKGLNKEMGSSPVVEEAKVGLARQLIDKAAQKGVHLLLPADLVIANKFDADAKSRVVPIDKVPRDWQVMDIGPKTIEQFEATLRKSKTVVWVGPVGVFEFKKFRHGTASIAMTLANLSAITIIGGGSTAEAVNMLGLANRMTHVSTGGGASLKFLEGTSLPGIDVLQDRA